MDLDSEVKAAIKELPPAERVIAVGLKNIFLEIKELVEAQKEEISQNHLNFVDRFIEIEQKVGQVICGKPLEEKELSVSQNYFLNEEKNEKEQIMKKGTKINDYWLKVMQKTAFSTLITEKDEQILKNLQKISTNVSLETLSITFEFSECQLLKEGRYTRRVTLNDLGSPINFDGDDMKFSEKISQSFFQTISTNTKEESALQTVFGFVSEFINEIVPYSLEYFVGVSENQAVSENEEVEEEDNEGEEPEKRRDMFQ